MSELKADPRYIMGRSEEETERLIQGQRLFHTVTQTDIRPGVRLSTALSMGQ